MAQRVKSLPAMQKTWVCSLGQEYPLEKGMAPHSSILAWRIPWTEGPGGLQSIGLQKVGHNWVTYTFTFFFNVSIKFIFCFLFYRFLFILLEIKKMLSVDLFFFKGVFLYPISALEVWERSHLKQTLLNISVLNNIGSPSFP